MRRPLIVFAGALALTLAWTAPAFAQEALAPWWQIATEVAPTHIPPETPPAKAGEEGHPGTGQITVAVTNVGDASASGVVTITDTLPPGLTATGIEPKSSCNLATLQCKLTGTVSPYERLTVTIKVKDSEPPGTVETFENRITVEGGGAAHGVSSTQPVTVSDAPEEFGVEADQLSLYSGEGEPATQAGSHPFELTQTLVMNQTLAGVERQPVALPKDLSFNLPPGLIGDPTAAEQCTTNNFNAIVTGTGHQNLCSPRSVIGVVTVTLYEPDQNGPEGVATQRAPVFNLVPGQGEPARFGFEVLGLVPIVIDTAVRSSGDHGDYGVVASVRNATELGGLLSSQVTIWGVPGDPRHDQSRGWECLAGRECPETELPQTPFLSSPTSCANDPSVEPVRSWLEADSWADPLSFPLSEPTAEYDWTNDEGRPLGFEGCSELPFEPSIGVSPEAAHAAPVHSASTPTGLTVTVREPQNTTLEPSPNGRAEADVREATVMLPAGVQLSPSAANGLQACPEQSAGGYEGVGFERFQKLYGPEREPAPETAAFTPTFRFQEETVEGRQVLPSCPEASKVGTVHIKTPLLSKELEGDLYLAEPAPNGEADKNPFDSLVALYLVAEDKEAGVLVKQAGEGELNQATGQITTRFKNIPQVPFEELKVELFGGPRASVSTPAFCGASDMQAVFTPWSGEAPVDAVSPLEVSSGAGGGPCPSGGALAFAPSLQAQSVNGQAGAFTPFTLQIARPDGQQALKSFALQLPAGLEAVLASVTQCPEPQAAQGACGQESLIGHSLASAGLGSEPYELPGEVFLTGPYDGAPFGLVAVTPLEHVGPFDLGRIVVRSGISIDPYTAVASIDTSTSTLIGSTGQSETFAGLPELVKGVPSQIKALTVTVDRAGFTFNPTDCAPLAVTATLDGWQGASAQASVPFQVSNCASLPFDPTLTAFTKGQASKADGTSLEVKVSSPGLGQANIQKVDLQLPKALSSRLTTLQKACPEAVFDTNPASCDADATIGQATIHTPVLKNSLSGPAYLVSHGGAAFPDLEFVLQGEGVEIVLDGKTLIKEGVTYSKFESAPDAPFTTFETQLPAGPDSILTANVAESKHFDLCGESLVMPTTIVAQDGATIEQSTKIRVEGCGAVRGAKVKKLTRAQQLANALKACRKKDKHSKRKRVACEKLARKRYGPQKKARKASTRTAGHHA